MKFIGYEMASILQNVSQNRVDKEITKTDIRCAVAAAYLSIYPGKTMYTTSHIHTILGHSSEGYLHCVKGLENGNAGVVWDTRQYSVENSPSPATIVVTSSYYSRSIVKRVSVGKPSSIYPDLRIQRGETKILIETALHYAVGYSFTDGRACSDVPAKTAFGFFVLKPPQSGSSDFFNTVIIFTPRSGLFDDTAP
jgi:hypothetical protein